MVLLLLQRGANWRLGRSVNGMPFENWVDGSAALERGDFASAARLLAHGADVNREWATTEVVERDTYDETKTYLRRAALYGDAAGASLVDRLKDFLGLS